MFDLDGTLIATATELGDAVNDTLASLKLPAVSQSCVNRWIGHGTRELMARALAQAANKRPCALREPYLLALDEFDRHYRKRCGIGSHLYPQVPEVLAQLRLRGVKLALVTNKEARYTRLLLDRHQLTALLDLVISGDSVTNRKPAPDGILFCLRHFNVAAHRALFVGDSSIDVASARNAGVRVWALPYGYNMGQPIEASRPDRVIEGLAALIDQSDSEPLP